MSLQSKPGIFGITRTIKASSTQSSNVTPNLGSSSNKDKRKSFQSLLSKGPSHPMLTAGKENVNLQGQDVEDDENLCLKVSIPSTSSYENKGVMNHFLASSCKRQSFAFKHNNHARNFGRTYLSPMPNLTFAIQDNNLVITKHVEYSSSSVASSAGVAPSKAVVKKQQIPMKRSANLVSEGEQSPFPVSKPASKPTKHAKKSDTKLLAAEAHIPSPELVKEKQDLDIDDSQLTSQGSTIKPWHFNN